MIVTMDIGSAATVHPPEKRLVAERLMQAALANTYGCNALPWRSPEYLKHTIKTGAVLLEFSIQDKAFISMAILLPTLKLQGRIGFFIRQ
ncbi:hypothetical protein [Niabella ginsengisoli]|uniref:Uncharacterized protein n=1 Tax=Niabella ginsengisoli TaxID=522298 RepID=A0ABS9SJ59_9BACT|nr:hypothetical protein [Niabella ginsengisoli]MCH5598382.1 hypothetical protein [Niabella ginsengisoli]